MSKHQTFLVKYGIHNFVRVSQRNGHPTFIINKTEKAGMIDHAKYLIHNWYGDATDVRTA